MSHNVPPSFRSTRAVPRLPSQPRLDTPTAEARVLRWLTRSQRIVTLYATCSFYRDPQTRCGESPFPRDAGRLFWGLKKATSAQYQPLSYCATTSFILCSAWPGPQGTMHWTKYSPGLLGAVSVYSSVPGFSLKSHPSLANSLIVKLWTDPSFAALWAFSAVIRR